MPANIKIKILDLDEIKKFKGEKLSLSVASIYA